MMRKAQFLIDLYGDKVFDGYTQGETWNGWACPYFTFEQAERLVQAHSEKGFRAWYDADSDAFSFEIEASDDIDSFSAQEIEGIKLYPIGTGCWIWEIEDIENKEQRESATLA